MKLRQRSLAKDVGIFRDPGFLLALVIVGALAAVAALLLVQLSDQQGIPLR